MSTYSQVSDYSSLKRLDIYSDRHGREVLSYHFSQMYAVFILWPVPAEDCIFYIKKNDFGQYKTYTTHFK